MVNVVETKPVLGFLYRNPDVNLSNQTWQYAMYSTINKQYYIVAVGQKPLNN